MSEQRWAEAARSLRGEADFWSLRVVDERTDEHAVRNDVAEPFKRSRDRGAMLTAWCGAGAGYAATPDLSPAGLQAALDVAIARARAGAAWSLIDHRGAARPAQDGCFASPGVDAARPTRAEWLDRLAHECAAAALDARIVERTASLLLIDTDQFYLTSDGVRIVQRFAFAAPELQVVAHHDGDTEMRSLGGGGLLAQGGAELLARAGFDGAGARVAAEALQLLAAPNCPRGPRDLLLMPDQMMLQIHESIGHPLELDRILGDERNFAGSSFVKPEMFGSYRYGSPLLNVTFAPDVAGEAASYAYDDDGTRAERAYLIRDGILERPLGGALSQRRAGLPGVANTRASSWNRPPIDRMANLNLEPGDASLDALIAGTEHGILMRTNTSWSIDDQRNKFQFGCEYGQLIENGRLTQVVRKPNYRGVSAGFWRSLRAVGDASTFGVHGTPYCGKGEPAQIIRVGHASPACVFADVDVFGGA
ncbi:TldD/PmbA family protein [Burkholderia glumae]|uniref:TldD/PmbA family protein n=2 Tax=Burkholderia glumae TaxID=337 RepID=UPI000C27BBFA|nr:TldD/PmbA family protein [Burkholderia glumae]MCM2494647.1 TldD/PmbA family protein [Burkholderia glumae]MCM2545517.1 TldD/PmbA family protein [Burkholderia glumae]MCM2551326.1 TldD/PmbA family protein [Burkholderia glumae]MCQ0030606.1 TldD/PmbA family protein [Burkholderia glumae]NVE25743.1 TldD/PmbA family protein [Burkholderia glumae]